MSAASISIDGMSCMHCVMRVKKAIENLPGVASVDVEIGKATVEFDDATISRKDIESAIINAGYKIAA